MKIALESLAPLEVEIPGRGSFTVPAPTRAQVGLAIALRRETVEGDFSMAEVDQRRRAELRALVTTWPLWLRMLPSWLRDLLKRIGCKIEEPLPIDEMHPGQVAEVLTGLIAHYFGQDAAGAVAVDRVKKKALSITASKLLDSNETAESSPSPSSSPLEKSEPSTSAKA